LLAADDSVTIDEALAYATDLELYGSDRWIEVLRNADAKFGAEERAKADYAGGIDEVLQWDRHLNSDSKGALKYYYWRKQMVADYGQDTMKASAKRIDNYLAPIGKPSPELDFTDEELQGAVSSFTNAMTKLKADFGTLDKTYGDVFRVGRDKDSWPVSGGGDSDLGMTTLRNVKYSGERDDHTRWGTSGQTSTQIVVMTKPVKSWTFVPWGQSDREDSPHYDDQAEKAFGKNKMKSTWWTPEELAGNTASREELPTAG
jgi:acyl-homoserine lactone acylase PvdQ